MIISIASGKGGTGKTTVATNLAVSLGGRVQLLDCDVEEPNAHLFIRPKFTGAETPYAFVPAVDADRCNLCGRCAEICQFRAIAILGETVLVFPELCHGCRGCLLACPLKPSPKKGVNSERLNGEAPTAWTSFTAGCGSEKPCHLL